MNYVNVIEDTMGIEIENKRILDLVQVRVVMEMGRR